MDETITIILRPDIVYVAGIVNEVSVEFVKTEENIWTTKVDPSPDNVYDVYNINQLKRIANDVYGYLDKDKLKQIMIIHIDNALKYTEDGDDITISLTQTNSDFTITVADTGIGINEYTKEHIFERFYREDKARSRETGGNGLGLSIAYTLVNLQRGKISVDHNSPTGTKFTIVFPRVKAIKKEESS